MVVDEPGPLPGHQVAEQGLHVRPAAVDRHPGDARAPGHVGERAALPADRDDARARGVEERVVGGSTGRAVSVLPTPPRGRLLRSDDMCHSVTHDDTDALGPLGRPRRGGAAARGGSRPGGAGLRPRRGAPHRAAGRGPGARAHARRRPARRAARPGRRRARAHRPRDPGAAHPRQVHDGPAADARRRRLRRARRGRPPRRPRPGRRSRRLVQRAPGRAGAVRRRYVGRRRPHGAARRVRRRRLARPGPARPAALGRRGLRDGRARGRPARAARRGSCSPSTG